MTGLKDIKPVATLGGQPLYSAEQMQEYAKAKALEAAEELLEPERARNELIERIFEEK